ncbi:hypothetical protein R1flu_007021 [Riccia fluitans]|uniref:Uncharacterized protein n=1 Tax=Riccia fluitans TaxID=41844 RepID=A0ABD1Z1S4_9MARC
MGAKFGVKTMDEKVHNYIPGMGAKWDSVAKKLHRNPCLRFALLAGAEALYWTSFALAGLIVLALLIFFSLLLLGPYLTFTLQFYKLTPWSKSSQNHEIGFLLFVGSFVLFFTIYKLFSKYPQLRDMNNLSKIELIPVVFQIGVYYAFLSFCSLLGSLLTFDLLFSLYLSWSVVFYGFVSFVHVMSFIPWQFLLLLAVFAPLVISFLLKAPTRTTATSPSPRADHEEFSYNLRLRSTLLV